MFLSGHLSSGLIKRVYWFTPGQLQAQILNAIDPPNAAGPSIPKLLGLGEREASKMLDPSGSRAQLSVELWW
jgi:hypothetical protein